MATVNSKLIDGTVLATTAANLYASTNATTLIKKMTLCNVTATPQTVTIYLVPNSGAVGAASTIEYQMSVAAGATVEVYNAENHILAAGDSIQALCSAAASVSLRCSGIVIS